MNVGAGARLPAFSVVAPFFVVAPLGLMLAGLVLGRSSEEVFLAPTVPELIAATHAAVLGWLSLSMMGAVYQLGPATLGGRLRFPNLARIQFFIHVFAVPTFVLAIGQWDATWMSIAGVGVAVSFILFLVNAVGAIRWSLRGPATRQYFSIALVFLIAAGTLGVTYVGSLEHAWFPLTQGRVAGHAHVGLIGWLALMVMGSSYRLVPMFQVSHSREPRFASLALWITALCAAGGSFVLMADPPPEARLAVAVGFSLGPTLWMLDMWRFIASRGRRSPDIQLKATMVSLVFLPLAIVLGLLASTGELLPGIEPARVQLAYGIVAIGGWAGATLVGNGFKIVPFLVWYWRYRTRAGTTPVPLVTDLTNPRMLDAILGLHTCSIGVLAVAALIANLDLFRAGGILLAASGAVTCITLLGVVVRHPAPRTTTPAMTGGPALR